MLLAALQAAVPFCVWLFIWLLAAVSELEKHELIVLWHTNPYGTEDSAAGRSERACDARAVSVERFPSKNRQTEQETPIAPGVSFGYFPQKKAWG